MVHVSLREELARTDAKSRRVLSSGPGWKTMLLDLRGGGRVEKHSAPFPILVHCVEGAAEFRAAEKTHVLEAGDMVALEAGVPHEVESAGGVLLVHLAVSAGAA